MSDTEVTPRLELVDVRKRYGDKLAVRGISLRIPPGELFACLGPNGAGKTTTIKMITGLLKPTGGTVRVDGRDMSTNDPEARRPISYVPDQPYLYGKLTGRDFLHFVRDVYGLDPEQAAADMEYLIDTLEVRDFVDRLIETYSHGMRQRVAFAGALLHRPRALVVDEPMVGLDPKSMRIVKNLMRDATRSGASVFMSTHTLAIAEEVADRIGIIHQGKLLSCGTMQQLRDARSSTQTLEEMFLEITAEAEANETDEESAAEATR